LNTDKAARSSYNLPYGKTEKRSGRLMFIYISKEQTSAFNREIAELVGGVSPSGVTHQYKRVLKRLEVMSFIKG
jgi:hypothetical protein